ncbi:endonuclease domain-containing protein [[Actinomadura] parvosata]|uniref:endonuclease domain-containing protein n=1 Tax=[Actinomadura] parvosata TaxID=1955412 RepID=UPI00406C1299
MAEDDFARTLARQGGLRAVCRLVPGTFVDHCHATAQVRGVACSTCGNGLGHVGGDTVLPEPAALHMDAECDAGGVTGQVFGIRFSASCIRRPRR